jgi:predicted dienelactone hydrolase
MKLLLRISAVIVFIAFTSPANAIGFHYLSIPDDARRPIEIGIWYPSKSAEAETTIGMINQSVAIDGAVDGNRLPVVIFSHGNAGWYGDRSDTTALLAEHGIVAVSLTYPGDNYKDSSDRIKRWLISRPFVTSQVLDYVLNVWSGHDQLDKDAVGFYGFSAGAYTGLVELGGQPDWTLFAQHCANHVEEMICTMGGTAYLSGPQAAALPASTWHHDPRIKAAALVAPAFGFAFDPTSLKGISTPVELWGGSEDANVAFASTVPYLKEHMPNISAVHEVANAKHYSFLRPCSEALKAKNLETCSDLPGFDRAAFQEMLNQDLLQFFKSKLSTDAHG